MFDDLTQEQNLIRILIGQAYVGMNVEVENIENTSEQSDRQLGTQSVGS
jgi:hypothetical protein